MSNLEHLVSKILKDGEEKANQIISSANESAQTIIRNKTQEAEKTKSDILSAGKSEADKMKERIISGNNLEIRDKKLKAKQEIIDKVFDTALENLNNMGKDEFVSFIVDYCGKLTLNPTEELIVPKKYVDIDFQQLNAKLKEKSINCELKPYKGNKEISGGFVLVSGGIEKNNTFEALIKYYRDDLESQVLQKLF